MAFLRPENGIGKRLRDTAAITAVLPTDTVCHLNAVPRTAKMPYITYQRLSGSTVHYMGGVSASGLWDGATELTVFAETQTSAESVAALVRTALDGVEPLTVTNGADSCTFTRLHLSNEGSQVFDAGDLSDKPVYTIDQTYEWACKP